MCNEIQQCFDDCTLLPTCYEVTVTWRWCVGNYNVILVCSDDYTMLQHCVMMY